MILYVYGVFDSGISAWMAPLYMRNTGEALRWWQDICADPQSKVAKHPSDFTLFELGSWDDSNCKFNLNLAPVKLGTAIEYVPSASSDRGLGEPQLGAQRREQSQGE